MIFERKRREKGKIVGRNGRKKIGKIGIFIRNGGEGRGRG